jgi:hypothetical protein
MGTDMKNKIIGTTVLALLALIGVSLYDRPQLGDTRTPIVEKPVEKPDATLALVAQMEGKSRAEQKQIQAEVISRDVRPDTYTMGDLEIQILSVTHFTGGVEVMARAWRNGVQLGFGKDGSVDIERFRFYGIETFVEDPDGKLAQTLTNSREEVKTVRFSTDPVKSLVDALVHTINLAHRSGKIEQGKVGRTTSTFYPAAGTNSPVDGQTFRQNVNETLATIRAGEGNQAFPSGNYISPQLRGSATSNQYERISRAHITFDTSALGTDDITSATLSLDTRDGKLNQLGTFSFKVVSTSLASTADVTTSDHLSLGTTEFGSVAYADVSTTGYTDWTLNASGRAHINKSGISQFGVTTSNDTGDDTPTWSSGGYNLVDARAADFSGTASDPKLVVVHEAGAAPAAVGEEYILIFQ